MAKGNQLEFGFFVEPEAFTRELNKALAEGEDAIRKFVEKWKDQIRSVTSDSKYKLTINAEYSDDGKSRQLVASYKQINSEADKWIASTDRLVRYQDGSLTRLREQVNRSKQLRDELAKYATETYRAADGEIKMVQNTKQLNAEWVKANEKVEYFARQLQIASSSNFWDRLRSGLNLDGVLKFGKGISDIVNTFQSLSILVGQLTVPLNEMVKQLGQIQGFNLTFRSLGQDAEVANQSLERAASIAQNYGVSLNVVQGGLSKLTPAIIAAGGSANDAANIVEALSSRFVAFGLSADASNRVMNAVVQAFGKGKLMSEELTQQIAEADPAFRVQLAGALGVTNEALGDMVKNGEITNDVMLKILPTMGAAAGTFGDFGGDAGKATEDLARFGTESKTTVAQIQGMIDVTNQLSFRALAESSTDLIATFFNIQASLSELFSTIANSSVVELLSSALGALGNIIVIVIDTVNLLIKAIDLLISPFVTAANAIDEFFSELIGIEPIATALAVAIGAKLATAVRDLIASFKTASTMSVLQEMMKSLLETLAPDKVDAIAGTTTAVTELGKGMTEASSKPGVLAQALDLLKGALGFQTDAQKRATAAGVEFAEQIVSQKASVTTAATAAQELTAVQLELFDSLANGTSAAAELADASTDLSAKQGLIKGSAGAASDALKGTSASMATVAASSVEAGSSLAELVSGHLPRLTNAQGAVGASTTAMETAMKAGSAATQGLGTVAGSTASYLPQVGTAAEFTTIAAQSMADKTKLGAEAMKLLQAGVSSILPFLGGLAVIFAKILVVAAAVAAVVAVVAATWNTFTGQAKGAEEGANALARSNENLKSQLEAQGIASSTAAAAIERLGIKSKEALDRSKENVPFWESWTNTLVRWAQQGERVTQGVIAGMTAEFNRLSIGLNQTISDLNNFTVTSSQVTANVTEEMRGQALAAVTATANTITAIDQKIAEETAKLGKGLSDSQEEGIKRAIQQFELLKQEAIAKLEEIKTAAENAGITLAINADGTPAETAISSIKEQVKLLEETTTFIDITVDAEKYQKVLGDVAALEEVLDQIERTPWEVKIDLITNENEVLASIERVMQATNEYYDAITANAEATGDLEIAYLERGQKKRDELNDKADKASQDRIKALEKEIEKGDDLYGKNDEWLKQKAIKEKAIDTEKEKGEKRTEAAQKKEEENEKNIEAIKLRVAQQELADYETKAANERRILELQQKQAENQLQMDIIKAKMMEIQLLDIQAAKESLILEQNKTKALNEQTIAKLEAKKVNADGKELADINAQIAGLKEKNVEIDKNIANAEAINTLIEQQKPIMQSYISQLGEIQKNQQEEFRLQRETLQLNQDARRKELEANVVRLGGLTESTTAQQRYNAAIEAASPASIINIKVATDEATTSTRNLEAAANNASTSLATGLAGTIVSFDQNTTAAGSLATGVDAIGTAMGAVSQTDLSPVVTKFGDMSTKVGEAGIGMDKLQTAVDGINSTPINPDFSLYSVGVDSVVETLDVIPGKIDTINQTSMSKPAQDAARETNDVLIPSIGNLETRLAEMDKASMSGGITKAQIETEFLRSNIDLAKADLEQFNETNASLGITTAQLEAGKLGTVIEEKVKAPIQDLKNEEPAAAFAKTEQINGYKVVLDEIKTKYAELEQSTPALPFVGGLTTVGTYDETLLSLQQKYDTLEHAPLKQVWIDAAQALDDHLNWVSETNDKYDLLSKQPVDDAFNKATTAAQNLGTNITNTVVPAIQKAAQEPMTNPFTEAITKAASLGAEILGIDKPIQDINQKYMAKPMEDAQKAVDALKTKTSEVINTVNKVNEEAKFTIFDKGATGVEGFLTWISQIAGEVLGISKPSKDVSDAFVQMAATEAAQANIAENLQSVGISIGEIAKGKPDEVLGGAAKAAAPLGKDLERAGAGAKYIGGSNIASEVFKASEGSKGLATSSSAAADSVASILKSLGDINGGTTTHTILIRKQTVDANFAGGPIAAGHLTTINELGKEAFLSKGGHLSMINKPKNSLWRPPVSGTIIPAHIAKSLDIPSSGVNITSGAARSVHSIGRKDAGGRQIAQALLTALEASGIAKAGKFNEEAQATQAAQIGKLTHAINKLVDKNWDVNVNVKERNTGLGGFNRSRGML